MRSRLSLRFRILALVLSMVALGFIASVATLTWQAQGAQRSLALQYAEQLARSQAHEVEQQLNVALDGARTLSQALAGLKASGQASRSAADAMLRRVLEETPAFIGVWTAWEPGAFDGRDSSFANTPGHDASGRYVPYWNRGHGQAAVEPLADYDSAGPGDYYQLAKKSGQETLLEPYRYKIGGQDVLITTVSVPIVINGQVVGVAGVDIALADLQARVGAIKPYGTGFAALVSQGGLYVADADAANVGQAAGAALTAALADVRAGKTSQAQLFNNKLGTEVTQIAVAVRPGKVKTPWAFAITVPDDQVLAEVRQLRLTALAIGLASLVAVSAGLVLMLERLVLRPLGGEPAVAAALARRVAAGDLSTPIHLKAGDSRSLMAALRTMQGQLADVVAGVRGNAEGVAVASAQIAQGNSDLSSRTEAQASALQQTASSMEQLSATVRLNADNARLASDLAAEVSGIASQGGQAVTQVVETMKGISGSSQQIANIIGTIDGIAFQTNILALNAAVEAARAGEQGRGFAVVAGEVRTLAQRAAAAAREIKGLIGDSVDRIERGTAQTGHAGATMAQVVASIQRVTTLMREISDASREQSQGVAQVGQAVSQMDQATQQNAALVEQSAAAAQNLRQQADRLVQAVAVFKLQEGHAGEA